MNQAEARQVLLALARFRLERMRRDSLDVARYAPARLERISGALGSILAELDDADLEAHPGEVPAALAGLGVLTRELVALVEALQRSESRCPSTKARS